MSGDITHDHLNQLADRLEGSFRREIDQVRGDVREDIRSVHARVRSVDDKIGLQNGRVLKAEERLAAITTQVATLRHDFTGHLEAHGLSKRLPNDPMSMLSGPTQIDLAKVGKGYIAGAVAAVIALAGVGNALFEFLGELVKRMAP